MLLAVDVLQYIVSLSSLFYKYFYVMSYNKTIKITIEPFQAQWCQMVTLQSVQIFADLSHHFKFFDIRALWRSGLSARVPECQKKLKMVG